LDIGLVFPIAMLLLLAVISLRFGVDSREPLNAEEYQPAAQSVAEVSGAASFSSP
jgi:hypothetical protein